MKKVSAIPASPNLYRTLHRLQRMVSKSRSLRLRPPTINTKQFFVISKLQTNFHITIFEFLYGFIIFFSLNPNNDRNFLTRNNTKSILTSLKFLSCSQYKSCVYCDVNNNLSVTLGLTSKNNSLNQKQYKVEFEYNFPTFRRAKSANCLRTILT